MSFQNGSQGDQQSPGWLDLLIIHDATGSQSPYISKTTKRCKEICYILKKCDKLDRNDGLRVGLIAFRDHPPQDTSFVVNDFGGFTYDIEDVQRNLEGLTAEGGGDPPEAVTAALAHALSLGWRDEAVKVAVLVTDAPPHGIGESSDMFPKGCPDGHDPLVLARKMHEKKIILTVVACEPALSSYLYANEFYQALAQLTTGVMFPLTDTNLLAAFIIGSTIENLELDFLARKCKQYVQEKWNKGMSVDQIVKHLEADFQDKDQQTTTIQTDNIYTSVFPSDVIKIWAESDSLVSAKAKVSSIRKIKRDRFIREYQEARRNNANPLGFTVQITLKNLGFDAITFTYFDTDGQPHHGIVRPRDLQPMHFHVNIPYTFELYCQREQKIVGLAFSKQEDMALDKYFN